MKTSLCDALITLRIQLSECFGPASCAWAPGLEFPAKVLCGADRGRTDDIQLAKLALYQLSYSPTKHPSSELVGLGGLEPPTSRLSGVRSRPTEL